MIQTVEEIDRQIADLEEQLQNVKGNKTEVYTRIVGYYRSVSQWNEGKRSEYNNRKLFNPGGKDFDERIKEKSNRLS